MESSTAPYTNEYLLTTKDGSTWELKSSVASLGDHVGHTVSATGVVENARMHNLKEDAQEAARSRFRRSRMALRLRKKQKSRNLTTKPARAA